jgi:TusA-related sulfurtransferase
MGEIFELNCNGMVCPMPVAQTKKLLAKMEKGDILEVRGNFIEASENITRYVENNLGKVIEHQVEGENYYLKIIKI